MFMDLKTQLETVAKNHQASIQNLETKFNRLVDKQSGRPSRSLLTKNTLIEVGKFTFHADFVILEMEEDSKVPITSWRPFFSLSMSYSTFKQEQLNLDIDVIDEILEEDFDALLDEGSKILHSIEGTLLEEEIFAEFDEFMLKDCDENSNLNRTEDPPFGKKFTISTDYKIKTSLKTSYGS
ncbi:hypothetical protein Tco_1028648 [Tanacetum coccineum]|uniref:Reverse transcriptase domain-containing protein n=1 Tax=Tanacetum coccineum TaxID=301880 RepID=A0ABQ5G198_9ASTR